MSGRQGFLLDTNVVIDLLRYKEIGRYLDRRFSLRSQQAFHAISVISLGEISALTKQWSWSEKKVVALGELLEAYLWIDISDVEIRDAYGEIVDSCRRRGRPIGENDSWIAACSAAAGLTLLTRDSDFDKVEHPRFSHIHIDQNELGE